MNADPSFHARFRFCDEDGCLNTNQDRTAPISCKVRGLCKPKLHRPIAPSRALSAVRCKRLGSNSTTAVHDMTLARIMQVSTRGIEDLTSSAQYPNIEALIGRESRPTKYRQAATLANAPQPREDVWAISLRSTWSIPDGGLDPRLDPWHGGNPIRSAPSES